jgi:hypothetical protein
MKRIMNLRQIEEEILEIIHQKTGWGNPLRPNCEFEDLTIKDFKEKVDETQILNFQYIFDEDGFSQYDKTHVLKGTARISSRGTILKIELEEFHTGVATISPPYKSS